MKETTKKTYITNQINFLEEVVSTELGYSPYYGKLLVRTCPGGGSSPTQAIMFCPGVVASLGACSRAHHVSVPHLGLAPTRAWARPRRVAGACML
jgi:hypothetical protein